MATSYLTKTFGSAGSLTTWTLSCWVKKVGRGIEQRIFSCDDDASGNNDQWMKFDGSDILQFSQYQSGYTQKIETNRKFKDNSGYYHIVLVWDTTNASAGDRTRIYINGVRETSFSSEVQASSSLGSLINNTTYPFEIGRRGLDGSQYFPGNLSNIAFVDGTALDPTSFGEVDSTSGIWKFKAPSGITWGTNGFWLKGENSANLGLDSANSNNFTTGGGTPTQSIDTPSNVFPVFNSLEYYGSDGATLSNANTTYATPSAGHRYLRASLAAASGKFYFECKLDTAAGSGLDVIGITDHEMNDGTDELSQDANSIAYVSDGSVRKDGSNVDTGEGTYTSGDIISVAVDITNSKIYFRKNDGAWINSGDPAAGTNGYSIAAVDTTSGGFYHFAAGDWVNPGSNTWSANFGTGFFGTSAVASAGTSSSGDDSVWEYDCPTGYYGMNTKNINTYG